MSGSFLTADSHSRIAMQHTRAVCRPQRGERGSRGQLLAREAARPGAAWVSIDSAHGRELEGCEVAAGALEILHASQHGPGQQHSMHAGNSNGCHD